MIPIGGRPILWHIMKSYAQHGFKDFVLCLGYKGWLIKGYFLDYRWMSSDLWSPWDRAVPPSSWGRASTKTGA